MQRLEDFEFYEADERIKSLPSSFGLIAEQEDGTFIYGNHTYGRSVKWEFVPFLNRFGWVVREIWKDDGRWVTYP